MKGNLPAVRGSPEARIRIPYPPQDRESTAEDIHRQRAPDVLQHRPEWMTPRRDHFLFKLHLKGIRPLSVQEIQFARAITLGHFTRVVEPMNILCAGAWRVVNRRSRRHPVPLEAQPILLRANTSESFEIYFVAAGSTLVLAYISLRAGLRLLERGVAIRKQWYEGTQAKFAGLKEEQEYKKLKREVEMPPVEEKDEHELVSAGYDTVLKIQRKVMVELNGSLKKYTAEEVRALIDRGEDRGVEVDSFSIGPPELK